MEPIILKDGFKIHKFARDKENNCVVLMSKNDGKLRKIITENKEVISKRERIFENAEISGPIVDELITSFENKNKEMIKNKLKPIVEEVIKNKGKKVSFKLSGKSYNAIAFDTEDETNKFLKDNPKYGVIGKDKAKIYVAHNDDKGLNEAQKLHENAVQDMQNKIKSYVLANVISDSGSAARVAESVINLFDSVKSLGKFGYSEKAFFVKFLEKYLKQKG